MWKKCKTKKQPPKKANQNAKKTKKQKMHKKSKKKSPKKEKKEKQKKEWDYSYNCHPFRISRQSEIE